MTPGEIALKRLISTENGLNKHSRAGERNDHQELTHQTTLPPGRETNGRPAPGPRAIPQNLPQAWLHALAERPEPETSIPGTPKRPPCSARGEEERFEQAPGKCPKERTGPLDSAIQSRHRQSGGRPPSRNCKRKPPGGEKPCRTPTKNHGATTTPKEKVREKMGGKLPSCRTNHP